MLFLGSTFFGGRHVLDPTPTQAKNVDTISINNGTFDHLFVSRNPDLKVENENDEWDYDTVLNANFDDSLDAGNSGFSLRNTDHVIIKCREVGTYKWITILSKEINTIEDFKITKQDYYNPSKKNLEYMVVSVCNGIENTYVTENIYSEFDGLYICDKDNIYGTMFNLDYCDTTRDISSSTLDLINNRYPTVVSNSISDYNKGSVSGDFIRFNQDTMEVDLPRGIKYRDDVKTWLNNKRPKILKFYDGRIWLVSITGQISDSGDEHNDLRKISFEWVEIGNVKDMETLYMSGLSDVGKEWWY